MTPSNMISVIVATFFVVFMDARRYLSAPLCSQAKRFKRFFGHTSGAIEQTRLRRISHSRNQVKIAGVTPHAALLVVGYFWNGKIGRYEPRCAVILACPMDSHASCGTTRLLRP